MLRASNIPRAKKIIFDHSRFRKPGKSLRQDQPIVDLFAEHIRVPKSGSYGYSYWLRKVKQTRINLHLAERLIQIMKDRSSWVKQNKGTELQCDRWLTNQFKEIGRIGIDRYIAKNSRQCA